jgi:hypothetical protein
MSARMARFSLVLLFAVAACDAGWQGSTSGGSRAEATRTVLMASRASTAVRPFHLGEAINVVEIHFCSLAANGSNMGRTSGDSATVGMESIDGLRRLEHPFNTPMSIATGLGLRFTP